MIKRLDCLACSAPFDEILNMLFDVGPIEITYNVVVSLMDASVPSNWGSVKFRDKKLGQCGFRGI